MLRLKMEPHKTKLKNPKKKSKRSPHPPLHQVRKLWPQLWIQAFFLIYLTCHFIANAQQQKPGTATNAQTAGKAGANAPSKTAAAAGTATASKDAKSVAAKPAASGMTTDEEKKLAAFKLKLAEMTAERKIKEDTVDGLRSLISIKQQIEKS